MDRDRDEEEEGETVDYGDVHAGTVLERLKCPAECWSWADDHRSGDTGRDAVRLGVVKDCGDLGQCGQRNLGSRPSPPLRTAERSGKL